MRVAVGLLKLHSVGGYVATLGANRSTEYGRDIEQGAVTQWVVHDVETGTTPQCNNVALDIASDLTDRHDRAKSRVSIGYGITVSQQLRPGPRTDTVGAD